MLVRSTWYAQLDNIRTILVEAQRADEKEKKPLMDAAQSAKTQHWKQVSAFVSKFSNPQHVTKEEAERIKAVGALLFTYQQRHIPGILAGNQSLAGVDAARKCLDNLRSAIVKLPITGSYAEDVQKLHELLDIG
jgi:hypothetical protein